MLVVATLGAPERRRLEAIRRKRDAEPQPEPTPVSTGRATVIEVTEPFASADRARAWLAVAGEAELDAGLTVLNRALHSLRLVTADPHLGSIGRHQLLVARVGYGAGEQVADGHWTAALELVPRAASRRRSKVLQPQARLAAILTGRERALVCEELALRARLDLDEHREREAALQVLVALDAALAELQTDPTAAMLAQRLDELRAQRDGVTLAAQAALAGPLAEDQRAVVAFTLERIESALRARAVANA